MLLSPTYPPPPQKNKVHPEFDPLLLISVPPGHTKPLPGSLVACYQQLYQMWTLAGPQSSSSTSHPQVLPASPKALPPTNPAKDALQILAVLVPDPTLLCWSHITHSHVQQGLPKEHGHNGLHLVSATACRCAILLLQCAEPPATPAATLWRMRYALLPAAGCTAAQPADSARAVSAAAAGPA